MRGVQTTNTYVSPTEHLTRDTSTSMDQQATATTASQASSTSTQSAQNTGFFGAEGPTFRDVLDAVNPLNHIPIVSDMLAEETGHTPSTGSKLLGGAMFGPIGFVASLVDVVFSQQTGKGAMGSMVAALSGNTPATTQLASAASDTSSQTASAAPVTSVETKEYASLNADSLSITGASADRNKALLALYGGSAPSAHQSYKKAQLLPYLKDVNKSQVI